MCTGFPAGYFFNAASTEHWLRFFAINLPFAPLWEEIGWRGYLLPRLEALMTPFAASMVVGVIWGIWHTPWKLMIAGSAAGWVLLCFFVAVLGMSILFAWVYNATKGNLSVLVLLHASYNSSVNAYLGHAMDLARMKPFLAVTLGIWLGAVALLLIVGPQLSYTRVLHRLPHH
jgi:membrane protease YdiL (CAAX protease family)